MSQQVTTQIRRLVAAFPQPPVSAETVAVYVDALSDMDPDTLRLAVDLVIRSDEWFPKIKRLMTACEEFQLSQLSAAEDGKWIKRWLSRAPNGYDPATGIVYKPKVWPNPVMEEAVRLLGWSRICQSEEQYFGRDWEKAWAEAKGLVLKRTAAGEIGNALKPGDDDRPALKAVS